MAWAEKMNQQRYGGYSDWRVPTDAEYKTLYDPRRRKKSYAKEPVGYPEAFEDGGESGSGQERRSCQGRLLVMSSARPRGRLEAYGFDFRRGNVLRRNIRDAQDDLSIRLVRTGPPRAQGIVVLKSHDIAPINQALAGFVATCPEHITTYDLGGSTSNTKGIIDRIHGVPAQAHCGHRSPGGPGGQGRGAG